MHYYRIYNIYIFYNNVKLCFRNFHGFFSEEIERFVSLCVLIINVKLFSYTVKKKNMLHDYNNVELCNILFQQLYN